MICLLIDYLIFEIRKKRDTWLQVFVFLLVQAAGFCAIVGIWYPFGRQMFPSYVQTSWATDKLTLFWWNLRDLNSCEFLWTPILLMALFVWIIGRFRDVWLIRSTLAIVIYAAVIAILSPLPIGLMDRSYDLRYMVAIIPLGVFISARVLMALSFSFIPTTVVLASFLFLTSIPYALFQKVVHAPTAIPIRSTLITWLGELVKPQDQAYRAASEWLNANAKPQETVYVLPEFAMYPLMFHAPQQIYAWQFSPEKRTEYPMLPNANFKGAVAPDFVVVFGGYQNYDADAVNRIMASTGFQYRLVASLDVCGRDQTRPELFWHSFVTEPVVSSENNGTYIFRRVP
jgi:hypothetical protein